MRYGFLHTEYCEGEQKRIYKPIMTDDLHKAMEMYKYFNDKDLEEDQNRHEIAVFDYERFVYVVNNFRLFRGEAD